MAVNSGGVSPPRDPKKIKRSQVHALCAMVVMATASAMVSLGGGLLFFLSIGVPIFVSAIAGRRPFAFGALTALTYWIALQAVIYLYCAAHHISFEWDPAGMLGTLVYLLGVALVACIPVYVYQERAKRAGMPRA